MLGNPPGLASSALTWAKTPPRRCLAGPLAAGWGACSMPSRPYPPEGLPDSSVPKGGPLGRKVLGAAGGGAALSFVLVISVIS